MANPRLKPTPSASAERTKASVLQAAIDEFAQHGLAGGRVDRIARRAGVNKQALYYHFGDKDALFTASLVFGYSQSFVELPAIDWASEQRSPTELMRHVVRSFFDLANANRNHMALIADENRNQGKHLSREVTAHIRQATAKTRDGLRQVLERGQATGEFSKLIDVETLYLFVVGQPIFYINHCSTLSGILRRDVLQRKHLEAHRTAFVEFVMAALRP
jgi:TetR/AcrR family transcriptional regulator